MSRDLNQFYDESDLPAASEYLTMLLDIAEPPALPDQDMLTYVDNLKLSMPVEMKLFNNDAQQLRLHLSPPTQTTETSVFPVLHNITISVKAEKNG